MWTRITNIKTMRYLSIKMLSLLGLVLLISSFIQAQAPKNADDLKNKYRVIEVSRFEVSSTLNIPTNKITLIMLEIVDQLDKLKKFKKIYKANLKNEFEKDSSNEPKIRLTGSIIDYNPGLSSGDKEMFAKVVAKIKFIDAADGKTLLEEVVDGRVLLGILSDTATHKLGKEVAKITKKNFF